MKLTNRIRQQLPFLYLAIFLAFGPTTNAASQSKAQASDHFEAAVFKFNDDDMKASLLELKKALNLNPDLLPGRILLARIFLRLGNGAAADAVIKNARQLGVDPVLVWPIRAEALFMQLKFKELLAQVPTSGLPPEIQSHLLVQRGRANLELGLFKDAESSFNAATALTPLEPTPRILMASVAFRKNDLAIAKTRAKTATTMFPEEAEGWNILGSVAHARSRFEQALSAYDQTLQLDPEHKDARISRAGLLMDLKRVDQAEQDIEYLKKFYPRDPRGTFLESIFLSHRKQKDQARKALSRTTTLLTELGETVIDQSVQLQLLAGVANFEIGSLERAQTYLRKYIAHQPNQPGPRKLLATILIRQKNTAEAIQILEKGLGPESRDSELLLMLGTAWMQLGQHIKATSYLEKAAALKSESPQVHTRLALSRLGAGDFKRGIKELNALFAKDAEKYQTAGIQLTINYLKRGQNREAIRIAEKLQNLTPNNLTVLNLLASAQLSEGLLDEARNNYQKILAREPEFMPAMINLAQLAGRQGKVDPARQRYLAVLKKQPTNLRAMVELAKLERRAGRLEEALRWLKLALNFKSELMPAVLETISLHLQMENPQESLQIGQQALTWAPDNLPLLAEIARTQIALKKPDAARDIYARMSRIASFDTEKLYRVANLQIAIQSLADALYSLKKGLKADPMHLPSRVLNVDTLHRAGKQGDALEGAKSVINDFPNQAIGYQLLGDVEMTLKRYASALDNYLKAQQLRADSTISIKIYYARVQVGDELAARQQLAQWVDAHPEDPTARQVLADGLFGAGKLPMAITHYRKLISDNPKNVFALNNLAIALERDGKAGALELAQKAHSLASDNPLVTETLGWMLVRTGQASKGLKFLREAQLKIPESPEIRLHIAQALVDMGQIKEARSELKLLFDSDPQFDGIEDATLLLKQIQNN